MTDMINPRIKTGKILCCTFPMLSILQHTPLVSGYILQKIWHVFKLMSKLFISVSCKYQIFNNKYKNGRKFSGTNFYIYWISIFSYITSKIIDDFDTHFEINTQFNVLEYTFFYLISLPEFYEVLQPFERY